MYRFTRNFNAVGASKYCGDFVQDKARGTINGKPVYVNKERGIFMASHPNNSGWHITSLHYWDEVSEKQGYFGSLCHGYSANPQTGFGDRDWNEHRIKYIRARCATSGKPVECCNIL